MYVNVQATYPTCKTENKFHLCLNGDEKKWIYGNFLKFTSKISAPTEVATGCEYEASSAVVPQFTPKLPEYIDCSPVLIPCVH
jgi:hypothetical protein